MKTSFFENRDAAAVLAPKIGTPKGQAKLTVLPTNSIFLQKRVSKMKTSFFENHKGTGRTRTQNWDPQDAGKTHRTVDKLDFLAKTSFKNENIVF